MTVFFFFKTVYSVWGSCLIHDDQRILLLNLDYRINMYMAGLVIKIGVMRGVCSIVDGIWCFITG